MNGRRAKNWDLNAFKFGFWPGARGAEGEKLEFERVQIWILGGH